MWHLIIANNLWRYRLVHFCFSYICSNWHISCSLLIGSENLVQSKDNFLKSFPKTIIQIHLCIFWCFLIIRRLGPELSWTEIDSDYIKNFSTLLNYYFQLCYHASFDCNIANWCKKYFFSDNIYVDYLVLFPMISWINHNLVWMQQPDILLFSSRLEVTKISHLAA